ncbi:MAG: transpeptidase family protein [Saprospiraceae bacterium]|nr:transpeptidase family protein [Saprospiraceae bacterium]
MDRKKELLIRAYLIMVFFIIVSCVIIYRVFLISVIEKDKWSAKGPNHLKWKTEVADRGNIYADDMSLLVATLPFFDIRMDTRIAKDEEFNAGLDSLATGLARVSKRSVYEWKNILIKARKKGNGYLRIASNVSPEMVDYYRLLPIFRKGRLGGGLILERKSRREKPYGQFAARTLGEDRENATKVGLEDYFDKFLKGPEQKRLMKEVKAGVWVPWDDLLNHEVKKGNDLYTTIDVQMQDIVHHALKSNLEKYEALKGTAIVMEVETGAIKAISNIGKTKSGVYTEIRNYAVGELAEPGSTFKLAAVLAMLEDGYADLDTKVNLGGGKKRFYDRTMYDSRMHGIQSSDLKEAFEISSNVGIATLAFQSYGDKVKRLQYAERLRSFGLGEKTGIEIRGEGIPYIKDPVENKKVWYGTTVPWMSHGYELQLTPLQMLNFYNAIANDGRLMRPYLVSEIRDGRDVVKRFNPRALKERIASPENISKAQELLKGVVIRGTAKNLRSPIVSMAGKTGTTVVGYADKTSPKRYNASFAGYFPADNPKYSIMVVVYEPKGSYYGSSVAAPIFKEIAEKYSAIDADTQRAIAQLEPEEGGFHLPGKETGHKLDFKTIFNYVHLDYKDKGSSNWVNVDPFETKMIIDRKKIKVSEVPDVRGMGARDAMYVLENLGMKVDIEGVGKVFKQSITPGTENSGKPIKIFLH